MADYEYEARRCPFCASPGILLITLPFPFGNKYYVICKLCGCRTDEYFSKEEALDRWNRREDYTYVSKKDIDEFKAKKQKVMNLEE